MAFVENDSNLFGTLFLLIDKNLLETRLISIVSKPINVVVVVVLLKKVREKYFWVQKILGTKILSKKIWL